MPIDTNSMEVCGSSYQQECIQSLGREDEDEDDIDHGRDEYEEIFGRDETPPWVKELTSPEEDGPHHGLIINKSPKRTDPTMG